jgi:SAM-dependent methyltransferase
MVRRLFDEVASDYDQHVPFFSAFGAAFVDWLGIDPRDTVVDIGSGRGAVTNAVLTTGASVTSVDISLPMLSATPGRRVCGDARALPLRPCAASIAVGAFSIHLLPDPVAGLREAARVVRPGGRVAIALGGRFADAEWGFVMDTLLRFSDRATRTPTLPPPTPLDDVGTALTEAGLVSVEVTDATVSVPVESPEAFLRGEQAHGFRSLFDVYDHTTRAEVEADLLAQLRVLEQRDGLVLRRTATFAAGTVA